MLKIPNISIFYSVSCGPLSHVRSRQKLRSLTSLHMLLDRPVRVFFATSNLRGNNQHPSAGNCHSKCHLCRRRGFEFPGKLFRTTRRSPSSSLSTSPRLTCTARILAVIVKHRALWRTSGMHYIISFLFRTLKTTCHRSDHLLLVFSCRCAHASNIKCRNYTGWDFLRFGSVCIF